MKENEAGYAQCSHSDSSCLSFGGKEEYCEAQGRDVSGEISMVVEYIDELLFSNIDIAGSGIVYRTDEHETYLEREFNLLESDNKHWVWPLIETDVAVSRVTTRNPGCVTYEIATAWQVHQQHGQESAPYATSYVLEVWGDSAQATIREYDLTVMAAVDFPCTVPVVDRPMTPYDHKRLFDLLQGIESIQSGQTAEVKAGAP